MCLYDWEICTISTAIRVPKGRTHRITFCRVVFSEKLRQVSAIVSKSTLFHEYFMRPAILHAEPEEEKGGQEEKSPIILPDKEEMGTAFLETTPHFIVCHKIVVNSNKTGSNEEKFPKIIDLTPKNLHINRDTQVKAKIIVKERKKSLNKTEFHDEYSSDPNEKTELKNYKLELFRNKFQDEISLSDGNELKSLFVDFDEGSKENMDRLSRKVENEQPPKNFYSARLLCERRRVQLGGRFMNSSESETISIREDTSIVQTDSKKTSISDLRGKNPIDQTERLVFSFANFEMMPCVDAETIFFDKTGTQNHFSKISIGNQSTAFAAANPVMELGDTENSESIKFEQNNSGKCVEIEEYTNRHQQYQDIKYAHLENTMSTGMDNQESMIMSEKPYTFMRRSGGVNHEIISNFPKIHIFGIKKKQFTNLELRKILLRKIISKDCIFSYGVRVKSLSDSVIQFSQNQSEFVENEMISDASTTKIEKSTLHLDKNSTMKPMIPVDPHYIHQMNQRTSSHILKLEKFQEIFMSDLKNVGKKFSKRLYGKYGIRVKGLETDLDFLDNAFKLGECIGIQKKFQSAIERLLDEFTLSNFENISILLEETAKNMKRAISGSDVIDSLTDHCNAHTLKKINHPSNVSCCQVSKANKFTGFNESVRIEDMLKQDDENCMYSCGNHGRRHGHSNRRTFPLHQIF